MLKIYGSRLCVDCIDCKFSLDRAGVAYEFLDFADDLTNLKEFLALRDTDPVFAESREAGKIGIPCIIREDGSLTLDWMEYVSQADA